MSMIVLLFACLACSGHGRRVQSSKETFQGSSFVGDATQGLDALETLLFASTPRATLGFPRTSASRSMSRKAPVVMEEEPERRIDIFTGGAYTEQEFKDYYGEEKWQDSWDNATPLGDMKTLDKYKVGDKVQATVLRLAPFGAFCDIGAISDALLHISQICEERIEDPSEKLAEGDEIEVTIKEVDLERQRIGLTAKSGGIGKPLNELNVGDEVDAVVKKIMPFGAFCDIGAQSDALLHISEIADEFISDPSEKITEGETVRARIKEVDIDRRRIGISAKDM